MSNTQELQEVAESLSQALQSELEVLANEFYAKVKESGQKYGLKLTAEVNVGISSKQLGE